MARCQLTGKRALKGHNVSHANNRTRKWQLPNVHKKRIWVPELGRWATVKLSARALRTVTKMGLMAYCRKHNIDINQFLR